MLEQEKLNRTEILKELEVTDETLSLYEHGLGINVDPLSSGGLEKFTKDDLQSLKIFHRLRESGLTYNEINLLGSFSEVLKNVDFADIGGVKNLLKLSPLFRLKQSLNLARQEMESLRTKTQELEETLEEAIEAKNSVSLLESEIETKQKTINNLDRKLSETLIQKTQLEEQLDLYREGKEVPVQVKGKKAKELYQVLAQKESDLTELRKKNEKLLSELELAKEDSSELQERLELLEDEVAENEQEIEERYQEQIAGLKAQIEELISKKQKEWENYYAQSNEQHRKELLTLQKRHEQEILRLKQKIKEQIDEIEEIKAMKNPLLGLFKIGASQK